MGREVGYLGLASEAKRQSPFSLGLQKQLRPEGEGTPRDPWSENKMAFLEHELGGVGEGRTVAVEGLTQG